MTVLLKHSVLNTCVVPIAAEMLSDNGANRGVGCMFPPQKGHAGMGSPQAAFTKLSETALKTRKAANCLSILGLPVV